MWRDHYIDFTRWQHPTMWHVALESWQWIHQVAAPSNVIRGSAMTCRWIHPVAAPCNVTDSSGIMTLNSPGGSTLQCDRWLWDDMPCNLPKRPPHWNSTSCLDFDHITAVDMSFCTSLRNFIQIGSPSAQKNDVMSVFKMANLSHLGFRGPIMGSLKSQCGTSYMSSIETMALNCLVFEKITFLYFGNRQTNKQTVAVLAKTLWGPGPRDLSGWGAIISSRWRNCGGGAAQKLRGPRPPRPGPRTASANRRTAPMH